MIHCILCQSEKTDTLCKVEGYDYFQCPECGLIFMDPNQRLSPSVEKSRYDQHENDPEDEHYRKFLDKLFEPLDKLLSRESFGLDFGSGPGPTLSIMFEERGHQMNIFDPFYANDPSVFEHQYDFITCTETAEHLFNPRKEFERLWSCLKPGGYLGIMTKFVPSIEAFPKWHYRRDDTHVAFYSKKTFHRLADHWDASVDIIDNSVAIFKKPE